MDALNLKSKTVLASLGGILIIAGEFLKVGTYDVGSVINFIQSSLPFLVAIFIRHGIEKKS